MAWPVSHPCTPACSRTRGPARPARPTGLLCQCQPHARASPRERATGPTATAPFFPFHHEPLTCGPAPSATQGAVRLSPPRCLLCFSLRGQPPPHQSCPACASTYSRATASAPRQDTKIAWPRALTARTPFSPCFEPRAPTPSCFLPPRVPPSRRVQSTPLASAPWTNPSPAAY